MSLQIDYKHMPGQNTDTLEYISVQELGNFYVHSNKHNTEIYVYCVIINIVHTEYVQD